MTGLLFVLIGLGSAATLGSFRRFFDWRWPRQRYPRGGNFVRVIAGRIVLMLGVIVLVVGGTVTALS